MRSVAVLGVGNVSLDIARLLLSNPAELAFTDMPSPGDTHTRPCATVRALHPHPAYGVLLTPTVAC